MFCGKAVNPPFLNSEISLIPLPSNIGGGEEKSQGERSQSNRPST